MREMFYGCQRPTTEENQNEPVLMCIRQNYFSPDSFQEHSLTYYFFQFLLPHNVHEGNVLWLTYAYY